MSPPQAPCEEVLESAGSAKLGEASPLIVKQRRGLFSPVSLARLVGCVSSLAEGYDLGSFGAIVAALKDDFGLTAWEVGLLAGIPALCVAVAALLGGCLANRIGRKTAIGATCVPLIIGSLIQTLATGPWTFGIGRCVVAAGVGAGFSVVSAYLTEVTPAAHRGFLVSLEEVLLMSGIMLAYLAGWILVDTPEGGWRYVVAFGIVAPAVTLALLLHPDVPESPRFLHMRGRHTEAVAVMRDLLEDQRELDATVAAWEAEKGAPLSLREAVRQTPPDAMIACLGVACGCTLSGVHAIHGLLMYVLTHVMDEERAATWALVTMLTKLGMLFPVCFYLLDHVGRRPLMLTSTATMACGCCVTAVALYLRLPGVIVAMGICVHLTCFSIGMGPCIWAYCSEVLPTEVRGPGFGLAILISRLLVCLQLLVLPWLLEYAIWIPFAFFVCTNLATTVFVATCCPETAGVKLEEVQQRFAPRKT